jgi:hypothetical protein
LVARPRKAATAIQGAATRAATAIQGAETPPAAPVAPLEGAQAVVERVLPVAAAALVGTALVARVLPVAAAALVARVLPVAAVALVARTQPAAARTLPAALPVQVGPRRQPVGPQLRVAAQDHLQPARVRTRIR